MADKPNEPSAQKPAPTVVREKTNVGPPPRPAPPPVPATRETAQIRSLNSVLPPKRETARAAPKPPVEEPSEVTPPPQPTRVVSLASIMPPEPAKVAAQADDSNTDVGAVPIDPAAARARFEEVGRPHLAQLLEIMLEVRFGQASPQHIQRARPALGALAELVEDPALAAFKQALKRFAAAVDRALETARPGLAERYNDLVRTYDALIACGLAAFDLEAVRARREPVIVDSLLRQIDGVESPAIAKLGAVGLDRLDAIAIATPDDIARFAGVRRELAAVIIHRFAEYRSERTVLSSPDGAVEYARLVDDLANLRTICAAFSAAAAQWSVEARTKKRVLRHARERAYQRVRLVLARLGEIELVSRLDKQSFADRLEAANHLA